MGKDLAASGRSERSLEPAAAQSVFATRVGERAPASGEGAFRGRSDSNPVVARCGRIPGGRRGRLPVSPSRVSDRSAAVPCGDLEGDVAQGPRPGVYTGRGKVVQLPSRRRPCRGDLGDRGGLADETREQVGARRRGLPRRSSAACRTAAAPGRTSRIPVDPLPARLYNLLLPSRDGECSSRVEHQAVALGVVGSSPITHPIIADSDAWPAGPLRRGPGGGRCQKGACSSGDRAPASGAGCGGSIPPRRATFFVPRSTRNRSESAAERVARKRATVRSPSGGRAAGRPKA